VFYDWLNMIYVHGLMTVLLSVDVGLTMLANLTNIRSKWAMHKNHTLRERSASVSVTAY
jgi:hypothetical protein